jgi:hypothetical protein
VRLEGHASFLNFGRLERVAVYLNLGIPSKCDS